MHNGVDAALITLGLGLAALGQAYLRWRRDYVWDGVLFWVAALACLGWVLRRSLLAERGRSRGRTLGLRLRSVLRLRGVPDVVALAGLFLSFAAGWVARGRPPHASYVDALALWGLGVASFVLSFSGRDNLSPGEIWEKTKRTVREWLSVSHAESVAMVCLLLLALLLRVYDLERIPANLGGDEGTQGAAALELLDPPLGNPFSTGWFSVPTMSFLAYGMAMRVFGATVAGLRTLSALIGVATVVTTFLLARSLWNARVAWLAATLLAFGHFHIHFSRLGSNQIADGLFVTLTLWLLRRGLETKRKAWFAAAGAAVGLGWYGYFGARLVGLILGSYLVIEALASHRFWTRHWRLLMLMVAAAVVVAAPLFLHYLAHPSELTSRPNQVSIFASGWLARERELTGRTSLSLLAEQIWKSISAFNYTLDPTFWYRPSIPLLDVVSGLFFLVGLLWAIGHYRRPASLILLIWFCLALGLGWVMTENPPSSQRMVILAPGVALLVALGIDWLIGEMERLLSIPTTVQSGMAGGLLIAIAALNVGYYFLQYTPTRVYGNPTAEMTTVLARHLVEEEGGGRVYFHGAPFVYWDMGTLRFMARGVEGVDVPPPGEGEDPTEDVGGEARFVFHPERLDELDRVRRLHPGGNVEHVHSTADGRLLYAMYAVSP